MQRTLWNIIAFVSVFVLPATYAALVLIILLFTQENFAESIFWAYVIDILSGGGKAFGSMPPYFFTFLLLVVFAVSFKVKGMLRAYPLS